VSWITSTGSALAGRDVHQQILAVVGCDIAIAQHAVVVIGAAGQSIPRESSARAVRGEHPVEHRIDESEIELSRTLRRLRIAAARGAEQPARDL
jgi:hypothetical protein